MNVAEHKEYSKAKILNLHLRLILKNSGGKIIVKFRFTVIIPELNLHLLKYETLKLILKYSFKFIEVVLLQTTSIWIEDAHLVPHHGK